MSSFLKIPIRDQYSPKNKIGEKYDVSEFTLDEKETLKFVQDTLKKNEKTYKNTVNLGKTSFSHNVLTDSDWDKIHTVYIGDLHESSVVTVVYDKKSEQFIRKNKNSHYCTRVECRFYIQDKHTRFSTLDERQKYKQESFVSTNQTFPAETVKRILDNSFSNESVGLRT